MSFFFVDFTQQWRIFPFLAAACVMKVSVFELTEIYLETIQKSQKDSNGLELLVSNFFVFVKFVRNFMFLWTLLLLFSKCFLTKFLKKCQKFLQTKITQKKIDRKYNLWKKIIEFISKNF